MSLSDTIVAVSSAGGVSERALVRVSGEAVGEIASRMRGTRAARGAYMARMRLGNAELPLLALRALKDASFTGEDVLELMVPGNPHLVERVVRWILSVPGVRAAQPGEFSARAYLRGRMSLEEAEGVAAVIAAETAEQLEAARALSEGRTGTVYRAISDELTMLRALVEAGIDFTDQEDVQAIAPAALDARLGKLEEAIRGIAAPSASAESSERPRVAIVGAPNAGKSTLFNALLGRARSVVSEVAGTTRDVIVEELDVSRDLPGAASVSLADLAGLDEIDRGVIDRAGQERARAFARESEVVVYCDPSGRFDEGLLADVKGRVLRVRTKADVPGSGPGGDLAVCAIDGWHLPILRRAIADASFGSRSSGGGVVLPRHRRCLLAALSAIAKARELVDASARAVDDPAEVADCLRAAGEAMDELVGRVSPDDVLGRVFSTFCVGK